MIGSLATPLGNKAYIKGGVKMRFGIGLTFRERLC